MSHFNTKHILGFKLGRLDYLSYNEYLESEHWISLRKEYFEKFGYECEICLSKELIHLHHLTYTRLGRERLSDLVALCEPHHEDLHTFKRDRDIPGYRAFEAYKKWLNRGRPPKAKKKLDPAIKKIVDRENSRNPVKTYFVDPKTLR